MDFIVQFRKADGEIETMLIEVKPKKQTAPPKKPSRVTRRFLNEVRTWGVNEAKWKATQEYVQKRGWKFTIMTEKEISGLDN